jgi:hypothetical protein
MLGHFSSVAALRSEGHRGRRRLTRPAVARFALRATVAIPVLLHSAVIAVVVIAVAVVPTLTVVSSLAMVMHPAMLAFFTLLAAVVRVVMMTLAVVMHPAVLAFFAVVVRVVMVAFVPTLAVVMHPAVFAFFTLLAAVVGVVMVAFMPTLGMVPTFVTIAMVGSIARFVAFMMMMAGDASQMLHDRGNAVQITIQLRQLHFQASARPTLFPSARLAIHLRAGVDAEAESGLGGRLESSLALPFFARLLAFRLLTSGLLALWFLDFYVVVEHDAQFGQCDGDRFLSFGWFIAAGDRSAEENQAQAGAGGGVQTNHVRFS